MVHTKAIPEIGKKPFYERHCGDISSPHCTFPELRATLLVSTSLMQCPNDGSGVCTDCCESCLKFDPPPLLTLSPLEIELNVKPKLLRNTPIGILRAHCLCSLPSSASCCPHLLTSSLIFSRQCHASWGNQLMIFETHTIQFANINLLPRPSRPLRDAV